jgi:hypothetical protein
LSQYGTEHNRPEFLKTWKAYNDSLPLTRLACQVARQWVERCRAAGHLSSMPFDLNGGLAEKELR